jgi:hypothetical protein
MYTVKDSNLRSEDEFIKSMGNETSEWAQVSKGKRLTAWARKHWIWPHIDRPHLEALKKTKVS